MSREYAALPHEYWEEMDSLTDEEWGRLTRALLRYSMTGETGELPGTERLFWVRVKNREDRYQAAFEDAAEKRAARARMGAEARWGNRRECLSMLKDANDANTNSNTKANTKTNSYSKARRSKERGQAAAAADGERLKQDMEWLKDFCQKEGCEP